MIRLPSDYINKAAPYHVEIMNEGSAHFVTDSGLNYIVSFDIDDASLSRICYQLVIVNVDNKPSPRDKKLRDTIVAIIEGFFSINNEVMLYICDAGDGKQAMRARLFSYWFAHYSRNKQVTFLSSSIKDDEGIENFAALIMRNDNPHFAEVVKEFGDTIQLLNVKPQD